MGGSDNEMTTPPPDKQLAAETLQERQFRQWRREQFEEYLNQWRESGTPRFEMAAKEIDTLRSLIDEQLRAMKNTPASDMNYAGLQWRERAEAVREGK